MTISFEEFNEEMCSLADQMLEISDPEEDPPPVFFICRDDGEMDFFDVSGLFGDKQTKMLFAAQIAPEAIKRNNAEFFALHSMQWSFDSSASEEELAAFHEWREQNPGEDWKDNPIRPPVEKMGVMVGARDGQVRLNSGIVLRVAGTPPCRVLPWDILTTNWKEQTESIVSGLMVDSLMEAITGKKIVTAEGIEAATKAMSRDMEFRRMAEETWAALGITGEEALASARGEARVREEFAQQFHDKALELFPNYVEYMRSFITEHSADFNDQLLENNELQGFVVEASVGEEGQIVSVDEVSFVGLKFDPSELLPDE